LFTFIQNGFEGSFICALGAYIASAWRGSLVRGFFAAFARIWRESWVGGRIRRYLTRPSYAEGSAALRLAASFIRAVGRGLEPVRTAYMDSLVYRCFIRLFRVCRLDVYGLFLCIVPLFAILDYFIRLANGTAGTLWTHALLIFMLALCLNKWLLSDKTLSGERGLRFTPVILPILLYIAANIACMFANTFEFGIVVQGFRANVEYIFFFFAVFYLLDTEAQAERMLIIFAAAAFLVSAYGVYQYLAKVPMPQNWIDSAEGGISTRAFSIVTSPNILGSLMILAIPVTLSLFTAERRAQTRAYYLIFAATDLLCLMLTFSRGAWLGFGVAILIWVMFKDKRLLIPVIILGALAVFLVPSVRSRIVYALSPEYMQSSLTGGRMVRWGIGWDMFTSGGLFGAGLGHFGGAVAANNGVRNSFYMDNYYLKIAVETGFLGIAALLYLAYKLVVWTFKKTLARADRRAKELMIGCFCGIVGVLAHNIGENVFEVPMMVIYFYMLVAVIMYFGDKREDFAQ